MIVTLWRRFPEGPARNALRRGLYRFRLGIPQELLNNEGDTVVQVGMWRLRYVRRAEASIRPRGRLLLIEGWPSTLHRRGSFRELGHGRLHGRKATGWHESSTLALHLPDEPSGYQIGIRADVPHETTGETRQVRAVRLDDVSSDHGIDRVDHPEVTVDGAELQVLQGGEDVLQRTRRVLTAGPGHPRAAQPAWPSSCPGIAS